MKKKKSVDPAWNLQTIKNILTLKLCQYSKSGSIFSSSEPAAACSKFCRLETLWFGASQSNQLKL